MNNKGFTLIELLCTITIMSLIATMACANLTTIFKTKEKINEESKTSLITEAACTYIELAKNETLKANCLQNSCQISSNTLISEGLIDPNIINKEIFITIKKENNEKKCFIKEE